MWVSLFTVHLELAQHCSSAKPQYKVFLVLKIKIRFKKFSDFPEDVCFSDSLLI